jgi:hypothetical protein
LLNFISLVFHLLFNIVIIITFVPSNPKKSHLSLSLLLYFCPSSDLVIHI